MNDCPETGNGFSSQAPLDQALLGWVPGLTVLDLFRVQGPGRGPGDPELLSFSSPPSLPPSFLLSWQRLYPVALSKPKRKASGK